MQLANIVSICAQKDMDEAVISPGSRNAPLTVFFARHPDISTRIVNDERCAAYIALGMAQQSKKPVALVCTSGTAALNFGPGVAEAYYQEIPLLVLTADRPPEWIDQQDGQALRQTGLFANHCKGSFTLPMDTEIAESSWHFDRIISEAINLARRAPMGPVHINVPIREPFYGALDPELAEKSGAEIKIINEILSEARLDGDLLESLAQTLQGARRPMLLVGQMGYDKELTEQVEDFVEQSGCVLVADILANQHPCSQRIQNLDGLLTALDQKEQEELVPDLLISFGLSILSKNIKNLLRRGEIAEHWHIQSAGEVADTFTSLTAIIRLEPSVLLKGLTERLKKPKETAFARRWITLSDKLQGMHQDFFARKEAFGEFHGVRQFLKAIPENSVLHLGNSMSVRYANLCPLAKKTVEVYANRGTAGIDGCLSTAVGHALVDERLHFLIIGDLSFFYDRNALWLAAIPQNLRILLLNNRGGGIFRLIDGPSSLPELEEFFITGHDFLAAATAKEMGLGYDSASDTSSFKSALTPFLQEDGKARLLEVVTEQATTARVFASYRAFIRDRYQQER